MNWSRRLSSCWISALVVAGIALASPEPAAAEGADELREVIAARAKLLEAKLIALRRDIHAHPELGNYELRTSSIIAKHLRGLGLQVRTGVARTGVVGILQGKTPGRVVALRADMDALPVKEASGLPFASRAKGKYRGAEVDVMHACGHDAHVAVLLTVAEILAGLKAKLPGTVVFYFQPAEEGPSDFVPDGKNTWGAKMMVEEGIMSSPKPDAVFGLHVWAGVRSGRIVYRAGPTMASSDDVRIRIVGKQTHAGRPWSGIDPIVVSSQVVLGLQTIVSRQTDLSTTPTVISIGTIHGGVRYNIIPDFVDMEGTIRSYDAEIRRGTQQKVRRTVEHIAQSSGATADLTIVEKYDPTINDAALTARSAPSLNWAAGGDVGPAQLMTGAEDFSFLAKQVPGFFFFLGASAPANPEAAAPNHSPNFRIEESTLIVGVRALAALATDFLSAP